MNPSPEETTAKNGPTFLFIPDNPGDGPPDDLNTLQPPVLDSTSSQEPEQTNYNSCVIDQLVASLSKTIFTMYHDIFQFKMCYSQFAILIKKFEDNPVENGNLLEEMKRCINLLKVVQLFDPFEPYKLRDIRNIFNLAHSFVPFSDRKINKLKEPPTDSNEHILFHHIVQNILTRDEKSNLEQVCRIIPQITTPLLFEFSTPQPEILPENNHTDNENLDQDLISNQEQLIEQPIQDGQQGPSPSIEIISFPEDPLLYYQNNEVAENAENEVPNDDQQNVDPVSENDQNELPHGEEDSPCKCTSCLKICSVCGSKLLCEKCDAPTLGDHGGHEDMLDEQLLQDDLSQASQSEDLFENDLENEDIPENEPEFEEMAGQILANQENDQQVEIESQDEQAQMSTTFNKGKKKKPMENITTPVQDLYSAKRKILDQANKSAAKQTTIVCPYCVSDSDSDDDDDENKRTFPKFAAFLEHYKREHQQPENEFECLKCDKVFRSLESFRAHSKTTCFGEDNRRFICPFECGDKFARLQHLRSHLDSKHEEDCLEYAQGMPEPSWRMKKEEVESGEEEILPPDDSTNKQPSAKKAKVSNAATTSSQSSSKKKNSFSKKHRKIFTSDDDDDTEQPTTSKGSKAQAAPKKKKKPRIISSEEDDIDGQEEDIGLKKKKKRRISSSSEDDADEEDNIVNDNIVNDNIPDLPKQQPTKSQPNTSTKKRRKKRPSVIPKSLRRPKRSTTNQKKPSASIADKPNSEMNVSTADEVEEEDNPINQPAN